jgi:hypothetical protein
MKKGATVALAASSFNVVTDNVSLHLDWRRSQFAALAPLANPAASIDSHQLAFVAVPASPRQAEVSPADLFLDSLDTVGDFDVNYGFITFADPYDASWEVWAEETSYFSVDVAAPGAASDTQLAQHRQLMRPADVDTVPLVPLVSPPVAPTIGGGDAFVPEGNLGGTPLLAWSPPPSGADAYVVRIFDLTTDADMLTTIDFVGDIHTTATSARIPPDLLAGGHTYFATIAAVRAAADYDATPAATPLPYAASELVTARFSTDGGALQTFCDLVPISADDAAAIGQHYVSRVATTCKVAGFAAHTADELADLGDCVGILLRQQIGCAGVIYDGSTSSRGTPCSGYLVLPADADNVTDDDFFDLVSVLRVAIQDVETTLLRGQIIAMLERMVDLEMASVTNPASGETHSTCP